MPFQTCYVTDRHILANRALESFLLEAIEAHLDLIQVREKDLDTKALLTLAAPVIARARGTVCRVVINDRLDIALGLGAAGVHLGNHSIPVGAVRQIVPKDFLAGVSCHSLEESLAAQAGGADYILLGPVFETPSKAQYGSPLGLAQLEEIATKVTVPVLALGGITVERIRRCLDAGAAGVAGIRLFQEAPSVAARVAEIRAVFDLG